MATTEILSDSHWVMEDYKQRVTIKQWKQILLDKGDECLIFHGRVRKLIGKNLGAGVVEIYKAPLETP